ncbi:hypothetical protein [Streptomyces sp. NPDC101455]|uniref:hypothetical protein n=1 Tax=Streptomyces sp. NPDC101455 TaxID=3366142 RepID=UPI0037FD9B4B
MIGTRQLAADPGFGLAGADYVSDREVKYVHVLSDVDGAGPLNVDGALVIFDIAVLSDCEDLFASLAAGRAAGVVVAGALTDADLRAVRNHAVRCRLPLLTSTRPHFQWKTTLAGQAKGMITEAIRLHASRLSALCGLLDSPAMDMPQAIADLLSRELGAEVVVSVGGKFVAAAPAAAPFALASVLKSPNRRWQTTLAGRFARIAPLGKNPDQFLAMALKDPHGLSDKALVSHAAKLIGLALSSGEADFTQALSEIRFSAFQMLMTGHVTYAQRVMASVSPGLLDEEEAQVFIISCGESSRNAVMAEVDKYLGDATLAVRCPAYPDQIINVIPKQLGHDPEEDVSRLLTAFTEAKVRVGGSSPYPLVSLGSAYAEALDALGRTMRGSEKMIVTRTKAVGLADILPADLARTWASGVLYPVLVSPGGQEIISSVAMALEFTTTKAARILDIHRNTLHRRVANVFADIGYASDRTLDRITVSLAIQIIAALGADLSPDKTVSLHDVLTVKPVRDWAESFLDPLNIDDGKLLKTAREWVLAEFDVDAAGAQLGIAGRTVRHRIERAEPLMEKDLITIWPPTVDDPGEQRLSGIRPLTVALYASALPGGIRPALNPRS